MMNTLGRIPVFALVGWCLLAAGCGEKTVALPSGLKIADLAAGAGAEAKADDFVEIHCVGWLQSDETRFEDTHEPVRPLIFRLGSGERVRALEEGIVGMKIGGKRKIFAPAALAYGTRGKGLLCPANADVVFEIELLRIIGGFKIEDLKVGTGKVAKWTGIDSDDTIEVQYTGEVIGGSQKFDSWYGDKATMPTMFGLGERKPYMAPIPRGWESGIAGMKEGGKRRLTIPAELGFGKEGRPPLVPPNADMIYEVELIKVYGKHQSGDAE